MTNGIQPATLYRLRMQGFSGCDIPTLRSIRPWLKLTPAFCGAGMIAGIALRSPALLWVIALSGTLAVFLPVHPLDLLYNHAIRYWTRGAAIPAYRMPRRFGCMLGTAWMLVTALALVSGHSVTALSLGAVFVISPILYLTSDFCVASWIYRNLQR